MLGENEWVLADAETFNAAMKQLGPRRTRLLAVASCRLLVPCLEPPRDWIALDALNTVELFADTGKTKAALKRARKAVSEARESLWRD